MGAHHQAVRTLMRLSASQIQTFADCQRKWAWRYVEGVEDAPNKSAELGKAVHAELEKYLRGGDIDFTSEIGYIAASGLEHLPKPGTPDLIVEEEFHFEGPSGHTYLGYKDLEEPGTITDHKTTSDLKWAKTPEDLQTDIQATLYAVDYFRKHSEEKSVQLRWVYYQTRNTKKSTVTLLTVDQRETWNKFLAIEQIAGRMHEASKLRALDLPANINHCSAYGGCPHQGRCNLSPFDKMRSHMEQNKLTALLKNKNGAAAPAQSVPAAAVSVPLAFAPGGVHHGTAAAAPNKLLMRMKAGGAPAAAEVVPAAINPPEFQPAPTAETRALTVPQAQQELATSLQDAENVERASTEKRGRGRPTKAVAPSANVALKIKTLYLNCGPVGIPVVDAAVFIVRAKQKIAEQGLADYRFAEYGQGPGMLAVAVVAELDALEGVLPALRLDTTTPEGSIVALELQARAELVVR